METADSQKLCPWLKLTLYGSTIKLNLLNQFVCTTLWALILMLINKQGFQDIYL